MGDYLTPGTTYVNGGEINGPNLNTHVADAVFKPTAISARTLKDPAVLADEFLINDAGTLKKVTGTELYALFNSPGSIIQTIYGEYVANTDLTVVIPSDDTIPQNTEGTEIISLSITPRFATSLIKLSFSGTASSASGSPGFGVAIFRGAVVDAVASIIHWPPNNAGFTNCLSLLYRDTPATVSATTYTVRVGPLVAGTIRMNGYGNVRAHGGTMRSVLFAEEIKV